MTYYAYNQTNGWKYSLYQKKNSGQNQTKSFVWSLVAALVIVMIVAELLSVIDHRIQNKSLEGFSLANPFHISSVEAATSDRGSIISNTSNGDLWYVGPKSGALHFVGDSDSVGKILKDFSSVINNKTFKSWKNKVPISYSGKFIIVSDDLGKTYFVNPSDLKPYYFNGTQEAVAVLKSISKNYSSKSISTYKIASAYSKPKNLVIKPIAPSSASTLASTNGVDVVKYCKEHTFANPSNDLERACVKMQSDRAAKVAYFDAVNNHTVPVTTAPPSTAIIAPTTSQNSTSTGNPTPAPAPVSTGQVAVVSGDGPILRVGIFTNDSAQTVRASGPFKVTDSHGAELLSVEANQTAAVDYIENTGLYAFGLGVPSLMTTSFVRLVPRNQGTIFEVTSYENRPGWNSSLNDNLFLGNLELRYNNSKKRTWVIDELPMEQYLKGIAETSNISPMEYQKAMMVAARTYATYHLIKATKHADEYFIVDATYDQVYRGYGATRRLGNVGAAVDATRGQVVTYANDVVVTPFFSWSDGRTRSMAEVWGVDKPWLKSVPEPAGYSKTTLYGHGVGLSAYGALLLASDKYNYNYEQILKYYYQGISLSANYNNFVSVASTP